MTETKRADGRPDLWWGEEREWEQGFGPGEMLDQ